MITLTAKNTEFWVYYSDYFGSDFMYTCLDFLKNYICMHYGVATLLEEYNLPNNPAFEKD